MINMTTYLIGGALFIIACIGAGYYLSQGKLPAVSTPEPIVEQQQPIAVATSTHATTTYSVVYPTDFTKNEMYRYEGFAPKKYILGVQFTVPMMMATGTNLSPETSISVEQLPRAQKCTGDIFVIPNVTPTTLSENGVNYSVATSSDGGSGRAVEETVYALVDSKPCTAVRYSIYRHDMSASSSVPLREFDRMVLMEAFDSIRQSLKLAQ